MPRQYSFAYRRKNSEKFPHVCDTCVPRRLFHLLVDQQQHEQSRCHQNGILKAATSNFFEYSSPQLLPTFDFSASSSSLSFVTESNLNIFLSNEIEPDTACNKSFRAVVNRLIKFMQNNFPDQLRPSTVIKSESLGKGTAVKEKSDADLVVFLASYDNISELRGSLNDILDQMKYYLGKYGECIVEGTTAHAIKVSVNCHGHPHDVDILPSVDIDILRKKCRKRIYKEMASFPPDEREAREYYSAAFAPLQIKFVSGVPTKVKNLIRLMKYWRKTEFQESTGHQRLPSSYTFELIVIGQWENAGKPQNFNLCKGFYHVLRAVANYRKLWHAWTVNYKSNYVRSDEYYVVDPANPFNNVMKACNCWDTVAEKARAFLKIPLFHQCSISDGWI